MPCGQIRVGTGAIARRLSSPRLPGYLGQYSFQHRCHHAQAFTLYDQVPQGLKLLPAARVKEVLQLMLDRTVEQARLHDRAPLVEIAIGTVIA